MSEIKIQTTSPSAPKLVSHPAWTNLYWIVALALSCWAMAIFGPYDLAQMHFLMPCVAFLICASFYAAYQLRHLREQGESLHQLFGEQNVELRRALSVAHENAIERDMIEDALRESQMRFYHLSEATFEAICIHDNGTILDLNQNFADLVGYRVEELHGKSIFELFVDSRQEEALQRVRDGQTEAHLTVIRRQNGEEWPVETAAKIMPYNGRQVRVVALRDIRARLESEATQEAQRQRMLFSENSRQAILESSIDGILIFGEDDRILDSNQASARIFGWSQEELKGRPVAETVIAPSHRDSYQRMLAEGIKNGEGFLGRRVKVRAMRQDGSEFDSEVTTTRIAGHSHVDFVAAIRDISERIQQKRTMEATMTRLGAVLESMQAAIVIFDDEQRIVKANRQFCAMLSPLYQPLTLEGVPSSDLQSSFEAAFMNGSKFWRRARRSMTTQKGSLPQEICMIDGCIYEEQYVPVMEQGRFQGHLLIFRDVSNRKMAEAELKTARDAAIDSARFKSQFLANMSHEIRTPMNAIVGMTDLLMDTPLNEEQHDFANTVKQASDSLLNLINQILDLSKIEAGKMQVEHEAFQLRELLEGVAGMFAAKAQTKGIELTVDLAPEVSNALLGDAARVGQVLVNLLGNAIKFTESGEVRLSVHEVKHEEKTAFLRFEVQDSGLGIAQESLPNLFKPFVQADGSITRRFGGTGLGLAISKELVELMGGEIGVQSSTQAPSGTAFFFSLRFERQVEGQSEAPAESYPAFDALKVLVVDDNATNCLIVSHQLKAWKVDHHVADSAAGAKALLQAAMLAEAPYNVVLLDMQMPDQDGLSLAKEISEDPFLPLPQMILMSSLGHSPSKAQMAEACIRGCMSKPLKQSALLHALGGLLKQEEGIAAEATESPRPVLANLMSGTWRILAAEDNAVNQRVIRSQMEKLGLKVEIVSNGEEALRAVSGGDYQLLLMDCQMPVLDGLAASREIRRLESQGKLPGHLPIVAMTANALEGDRKRCLQAGMDDYLPKPVKLEALRGILERILGGHKEAATKRSEEKAAPRFSPDAVRASLGDGYEQDPTFGELVQLFALDTPPRLARLEKALQGRDFEVLAMEGHAIKGAGRSLGALSLGQLCEGLEEMAKGKHEEGMEAQIRAIQEEFPITLDLLQKMSGQPVQAA